MSNYCEWHLMPTGSCTCEDMMFNDFLTYVAVNFSDAANLRPGQQLYNMLSKVNPALAHNAHQHDMSENDPNKHVDPFYRDENITRFWAYVGEHWDD